uniref:NB-ARC domain-containing protein n=1 Tax=Brassica oleracea var. oleracea TaxID=109376 RepID=A0A0D3AQ74_BRAOL
MLDDLILSICAPRSHPYTLGGIYKTEHAIDVESSESDIYMKHIPQSLLGSREAGLESQDTSLTDDELSDESTSPASDDSNGLILESSRNNVRTVGIWGEHGVGKRTLVECVFNDISSRFQHHCFLSNVDNIYQNRISPSLLQHLISKTSSDNIFDAIKPFLVNRHVLLVIDGVHDENHDQLKDAMKFSRWLSPGSRVIMTSCADNKLKSCGVEYIYKMESLRYAEALQLFSLCAFKMPYPLFSKKKMPYPLVGFEGFSIRAVHFAGRLPLAVKVLGSYLYDKRLG